MKSFAKNQKKRHKNQSYKIDWFNENSKLMKELKMIEKAYFDQLAPKIYSVRHHTLRFFTNI